MAPKIPKAEVNYILENANLNATIGNNIKQLRIASGYSQSGLEALFNLPRGRIARCESGKSQITANIIIKCCAFFDVDISFFYSGIDKRSKKLNYSVEELQILSLYSQLPYSMKKYYKIKLIELLKSSNK